MKNKVKDTKTEKSIINITKEWVEDWIYEKLGHIERLSGYEITENDWIPRNFTTTTFNYFNRWTLFRFAL